jgi:putative methyltransferase (TIGR04325 family)
MKFFIKRKKRAAYGWFGDYKTWAQAANDSKGYAADNILEKTRTALLKIKRGEAVYERDSVTFDTKQYPFPVISSLLYIATANSNKLNVIDFGGSLGSTWFQVKDFLNNLSPVCWNIVEQQEYVTCGRELFEDEKLKFNYSIEECINLQKPNVILLSSVIQYLEKPHDFLQSLLAYEIEYILVDRTAFIKSDKDRLTRQIVPPEIYEATYPAWFFNEKRFLSHFVPKYEIIAEFTSYVEGESVIQIDNRPIGYDKGFLLKRF